MVPVSRAWPTPCFLGGHDVSRQDRQHRPVHGHGNARLAERDVLEQAFHVLDGVDGDAGLAHVAPHARMIGVVPSVSGEIEGDGQPFLSAARLRR